MAGKIIWIHGMGEKPEPGVERRLTLAALRQGLWCRIPEDAFDVAYWADVIHGAGVALPTQKDRVPKIARGFAAGVEPGAPFRRPSSDNLLKPSARHRADMEIAYISATADRSPSHGPESGVRGWEFSSAEGLLAKVKRALLASLDYRSPTKIFALLMNLVVGTLDLVWIVVRRIPFATFIARGFSLGSLLGDVDEYIDSDKTYRETIVDKVSACLNEARGPKKEPLCVIAQSMGCIVALDAIQKWCRCCSTCNPPEGAPPLTLGSVDPEEAPICEDHRIETFITLGSPLGLEWVRELVWGTRELQFPPNVGHWYNLYDNSDIVSLFDRSHAGDFRTRLGGRVIVDREIRPNFDAMGRRDPHNWHGYLSSPELADIVSQFYLAQNVHDLAPLFAKSE